ncbi:dr1-associated corepressor isoform X3 [Acanthopagrus latus]|uniref:dr1-associated corepressor isoform X3 n=1 Tax=Acanthopagrus latus TaxID=8177 RepID=UPI00187C3821|nr:dr1-associated corepressor isoform X3 [Acanthopagrus latus]
MPGQKRRYNVRFPPSRIKKIMQKDAEVGRIAMAVPVIISRALEMFLKCLLTKTCLITQSKLSTVVSVAHIDLVERATSTASQKDNRGVSMWPLYRKRQLDISVKKPAEVVEKAPRSSLDSLDNDSVSSESELYICF